MSLNLDNDNDAEMVDSTYDFYGKIDKDEFRDALSVKQLSDLKESNIAVDDLCGIFSLHGRLEVDDFKEKLREKNPSGREEDYDVEDLLEVYDKVKSMSGSLSVCLSLSVPLFLTVSLSVFLFLSHMHTHT